MDANPTNRNCAGYFLSLAKRFFADEVVALRRSGGTLRVSAMGVVACKGLGAASGFNGIVQATDTPLGSQDRALLKEHGAQRIGPVSRKEVPSSWQFVAFQLTSRGVNVSLEDQRIDVQQAAAIDRILKHQINRVSS